MYIVLFVESIENLKNLKTLYLLEKTLVLSIIFNKCKIEDEKMFKEKESIEILKILGLIHNIEEYEKIENHAWKNHETKN